MARPRTSSAPVGLELTFAQARNGLEEAARRLQAQAERARETYRARLGDWMQVRAQLDRRQNGAPRGTANRLEGQQERLLRELSHWQRRLKRMEVAARQVDLLVTYLDADDDGEPEPTFSNTDDPAAATSLRIIQAQEQERQRLAEEVHDGPAQVLTNALFQVEYLDRMAAAPPNETRAELALLRSMLREGLEEVRGFIAWLRPPAVEVGLGMALADQAAEFAGRHGINVSVDVDGIDAAMTPTARASVLRIAQEALRNVRKHSAATQVRIGLDGDQFVIADNGRGFDVMRLASGATRNFGLQFMRERAELMGSQLHIESRQGEGTRILLRVPRPVR